MLDSAGIGCAVVTGPPDGAKLAVTDLAEVMPVMLQLAPEQSPLQPVKTKPGFGAAVHVLLLPLSTGLGVHTAVPPAEGFADTAIA